MSDSHDSAATGQEMSYEELRRFSFRLATCLRVMERLTRNAIRFHDNPNFLLVDYHDPSAAEKLVLHNFDELAQSLVEACPRGPVLGEELSALQRIVILAGEEIDHGYLTWHEHAAHVVDEFFCELVKAGDHERGLDAVNFFTQVCWNGYDIAASRDIVRENLRTVCTWLSDQQTFNSTDYLFHMDEELALFKAAIPEGPQREAAKSADQQQTTVAERGKETLDEQDATGPIGKGVTSQPVAPPTSRPAKPSEVRFQWTPPMLEGYVFDLLKEIEYPTEREAVAWIAARSGKSVPSRATLRKTFAWQKLAKKPSKPRTTNEAQSGVSPAQNADAAVSHEDVTTAVLDIEQKLQRQLVDNERDAVDWTLQQTGADEEKRAEAIAHLIDGFRSDT